jgi:hypothetical protein
MFKVILLALSLTLAGCAGASNYQYSQTDYDDLSGREITTKVSDTTEAPVSDSVINNILVLGFTGLLAAVALVSQ